MTRRNDALASGHDTDITAKTSPSVRCQAMRSTRRIGTSVDVVLRSRPEMTVRFGPAPIRNEARGRRLGRLGSDASPIASAALRSVVLIAVAILLILVVLPAALFAAGT